MFIGQSFNEVSIFTTLGNMFPWAAKHGGQGLASGRHSPVHSDQRPRGAKLGCDVKGWRALPRVKYLHTIRSGLLLHLSYYILMRPDK